MGIGVAVKLDNNKMRIYLTGNRETIHLIDNQLKSTGYKNIEDCILQQQITSLSSASYSIPQYSMAYGISEGVGDNLMLRFEAWFPIAVHFTDTNFVNVIADLIKPLLPPLLENMNVRPNTRIADLKSRNYVTIFTEDNAALDPVLQLIQNFETLVRKVRKEVNLDTDVIPSDVNVIYKQIEAARHSEKLAIFGLMRAVPNCNSSAGDSRGAILSQGCPRK